MRYLSNFAVRWWCCAQHHVAWARNGDQCASFRGEPCPYAYSITNQIALEGGEVSSLHFATCPVRIKYGCREITCSMLIIDGSLILECWMWIKTHLVGH